MNRALAFVCMVAWAAAISIGLAGGPAWAEPRPDARADLSDRPLTLLPVVWSVIAEPVVAVKGTDELVHVAYELLFTNVTASAARIELIEAVDPSAEDAVVGEDQVVTIADEDVTGQARLFSRPTTFDATNYAAVLPPGESGIVYVDLTFATKREIPRLIGHRVTVSQPDLDGAPEFTAVGALTKIYRRAAVLVRPPLRGDGWVDGDGCCTIIGPHRFTVLPINGSERVPEHFAIDFIQLDAEGKLFTGDPKVLENWHYYGADVLAAAAGEVVEVVDDLPNQVPGELPASITAAEAGGNHVIIAMQDGRFALYAHMIPDSIVVEVGQRVRAGQLLGHLGNSGNTDAPHLHFHVMTEPSPLDSTGLPFVFDRMELQGRLLGSLVEVQDALFAGTPPEIDDTDTGRRRRQMPLTNDVLGFR
jgi:hypothetical protein